MKNEFNKKKKMNWQAMLQQHMYGSSPTSPVMLQAAPFPEGHDQQPQLECARVDAQHPLRIAIPAARNRRFSEKGNVDDAKANSLVKGSILDGLDVEGTEALQLSSSTYRCVFNSNGFHSNWFNSNWFNSNWFNSNWYINYLSKLIIH